jgi:hypothetical protein
VQTGLLWRNVVRFDPLARYGTAPRGGANSYEDVLLRPALDALKATLTPKVSVELSLAGEQGLSVFGYPSSWAFLMDKMRGELSGFGSKKHTFGVSFNWGEHHQAISVFAAAHLVEVWLRWFGGIHRDPVALSVLTHP